jgi:hypothetical protein
VSIGTRQEGELWKEEKHTNLLIVNLQLSQVLSILPLVLPLLLLLVFSLSLSRIDLLLLLRRRGGGMRGLLMVSGSGRRGRVLLKVLLVVRLRMLPVAVRLLMGLRLAVGVYQREIVSNRSKGKRR